MVSREQGDTAMSVLLFISDNYGAFNPSGTNADLSAEIDARILEAGVPAPELVASAELTVVLGGLESGDRAFQLGGSLLHALDVGRTVVIAYPVRLEGALELLVRRLIDYQIDHIHSQVAVSSAVPAFRGFFMRFGGTAARFFRMPNGAEPLAELHDGAVGHPAAFQVSVGRGAVYVVPYHVASLSESHDELTAALVTAVRDHRAAALNEPPAFLSELRLPGEEEVIGALETLSAEIETRQAEASRFARFRLLLSTAAHQALEDLVIETLEEILAESPVSVEDREDIGDADFWLVENGSDVALVEVKATSAHVKRPEVNKVDNHRSALDLTPNDLPGVLIANIFRNDDSLERRLEEAPHPDVLALLAHQNVLLLRTADVYALLSRKLSGHDAAGEFLAALRSGGGGWLEVTPDATSLRRP